MDSNIKSMGENLSIYLVIAESIYFKDFTVFLVENLIIKSLKNLLQNQLGAALSCIVKPLQPNIEKRTILKFHYFYQNCT